MLRLSRRNLCTIEAIEYEDLFWTSVAEEEDFVEDNGPAMGFADRA